MGARNTQGIGVVCNHCGYKWLYQGNSYRTSCPRCGWRVRIGATPRPYLSRDVSGHERREIHI